MKLVVNFPMYITGVICAFILGLVFGHALAQTPVVYRVTFLEDIASCPIIDHWEAMVDSIPPGLPEQATVGDLIFPVGGCTALVMTDVVGLPPGPLRVWLRACTAAPTETCSPFSNPIDVGGPVTTTTTGTMPSTTTTTTTPTTTTIIAPPSLLTVTPVTS